MFRLATITLMALISNTQAIKLDTMIDAEAQTELEAFAQVDTLQMARLLSKEDEEEDVDRQLTAEQEKKVDVAAKAAFKQMDANHDGKISYKEAEDVFLKSLYR